jgi:4-hydroxybenzoate polyprenyltransferase
MAGAVGTLRTWGRMVRFSHTLFALPFALSGAALAAIDHGITARQIVWILVTMVAARNAAMSFNRLADHELDARNPRTASRELPTGRLSRRAVWTLSAVLSVATVLAAFQLNLLCGLLSPLALAIVLGYSYSKRFTWVSHLWLGLGLAIAPVGGWLAVRGSFALVPWLLGGAVMMWVAGFDTVYACQDVEFDRARGLHSIPARFGIRAALATARTLHAGALATLAGVGVAADLPPTYWLGLGVIGAILAWEHRVVRSDDLSRLGVAFFNMNAVVSILYFVTVLATVALPGSAR